jgi:hypothetical protein
MPIRFGGFTPSQKALLEKTRRTIQRKVRKAKLPPPLASGLETRLATTGGETVYVTYRKDKEGECAKETRAGEETKSYTMGPNQIYLCKRGLNALYEGKRRLGAILFHELVHSCGGKELDAETYENLLFDGDGARPPTGDDWDERFRADCYDGVWVRVNPRTREVTDLNGNPVITFREP